MKKFISLLLVCLMVVPFGMLASTGVSADTAKTVYVSDNGDDAKDGSTTANAVKTLPKAGELLGANGGTIVIVDTVTLTGYTNKMPAHTGLITFKGAADTSKIQIGATEARLFMGGPSKFTDLKLECTTSTLLFVYLYNDIEFTDTFVKEGAKAAFLVAAQASSSAGAATAKAAYDYTPKDHTVVINGGTWGEVSFGPRQGTTYFDDANQVQVKDPATIKDYDVTATIGGKASIDKLFFLGRSYTQDFVAANSSLTLNLLGGKITTFAGVNDQKSKQQGYENGITVNIGKDFDISKSFEAKTGLDANRYAGGTFYGLSGETLYDPSTISYTQLINSTLVIDPEVYDEVLASGKVGQSTFKEIKKATVAPSQPEQPENPGQTPDTGDMTWVVAVVAAVAVMGSAVVLKKREN